MEPLTIMLIVGASILFLGLIIGYFQSKQQGDDPNKRDGEMPPVSLNEGNTGIELKADPQHSPENTAAILEVKGKLAGSKQLQDESRQLQDEGQQQKKSVRFNDEPEIREFIKGEAIDPPAQSSGKS